MRFKLITVLITILLFTVQCEKEDSVTVPSEGLIAYYPFNGSALDESGHSHDGIIYGAIFKTDRSNRGRSIMFDGIDDYIKLDRMDTFNSSLESFSISFWIKSDTIDVSKYESIMKTINSDPAGTMFSIEIHRGLSATLNIGVIRLDLRDNNDKYFTIYVDRADVFDNKWHNLTFIITSAKKNQGDVFIDGELASKDDFFVRYGSESPTDFDAFDYDLTLGSGNNRGNIESFFKGSLDEILFYNRPLTTIEILQLRDR
jgi:hypothetical protein